MQQARQLSTAGRIIAPRYPEGKPYSRPEPGRKAKKFKLLLIMTLCFLLALAVVAQYSTLVIANYRLGEARTELVSLQEASRLLELEVARLSSVGRIDQIARNELGMVEPEIGQLRIITAGLNHDNRLGE